MRKLCLILILATTIAMFGCGKKSSQQAENQQPAPAGSTPTSNNNAAPQTAPAPAATPAPAPTPPPAEAEAVPPPAPKPLVVPAGTAITVRLGQALGSKSSHTGDTFTATVADPVSVSGKIVIPASSTARGTVSNAQAKGKVKGEGVLQLTLNQVTVKGHNYPIATSMSSQTEKGKGKRTAVTTGAGTAIGAVAGGGKGAVIGGAAGFAGGALTGNKQIELPAESVLTFKLTKSLTLK